jgi:hypothetical protein
MSQERAENLRRAEAELAEHIRVCPLCVFPSKRDSCPKYDELEQAAIRAFKAQ